MWWTPRDIEEMDVDFYEDTVLVLQLQSEKEKIRQEQLQKTQKFKK